MKPLNLIIALLALASCAHNANNKGASLTEENLTFHADTIESFVDSLHFGQKTINKIQVYKINSEETTLAQVNLYELINNKWNITDSLQLKVSTVHDLHVEIKDFDNDDFNDIIFTSGDAARGGNIVQTLILFDSDNKQLKWIKNSEYYPNLLYNEKLDCIDAVILTGGQTTYFLKIQDDSLKAFANVDQRNGRITVEILDSDGNWLETASKKEDPEGFDRFINFQPIEKRK